MNDDPSDAIASAAASIGSAPPDSLQADSVVHRYHDPLNDRQGQKNGWYMATSNPDGTVGGIVGNHKTGLRVTWCTRSTRTYSAPEKAEFARQQAEIRAAQEAARIKAQKQAEAKAAYLWPLTVPADPYHDYIRRKQVQTHRARQLGNALVFDYRDQHGTIATLQFIQPDGSKRFLSGGTVAGCSHRFGPKISDVIVLAEGFATGATIHETTSYPVAVCGSAGNLKPVALAVRERFPAVQIIIAGDADPVGKAKALEAAEAVRGSAVFPDFAGVVHVK
jgi:putative DNA primase/helicase